MINNLNFRLASLDDIEQLVQLRVLMQLEVNGVPEDRVKDEYKDQVKNYFLNAIPRRNYFSIVAGHNGSDNWKC